jgi:hypothetical protein
MQRDDDLAAIVDIVAAGRQVLQFVEGHDLGSFRGIPRRHRP